MKSENLKKIKSVAIKKIRNSSNSLAVYFFLSFEKKKNVKPICEKVKQEERALSNWDQ